MEAAGQDTSKAAAKIKEWQARQTDFLDKTGLKRRYERENVAFAAQKKTIAIPKKHGMPNVGLQFFAESAAAKMADEFRKAIKNGEVNLSIRVQKQREHIEGTKERQKRIERDNASSPVKHSTYFFAGTDVSKLLDGFYGTGDIVFNSKNDNYPKEFVTVSIDFPVGMAYNPYIQAYVETKRVCIQYSGKGIHSYPVSEEAKQK